MRLRGKRKNGSLPYRRNYLVSGITYGPSNETLQISYGDLYQGETGDRREVSSSTQNNGKISSTTNSVSGETVTYAYDSLNRLITAQNGSVWGQQFVYDGFGNLYQKNALAGTVPTFSLNVDATTNRLTNTGSPAFVYDNNGNMLTGPSGNNIYDFLNRVVSFSQSGSPQGYYGYDASNRRIYKMNVLNHSPYTKTETYYLYGINGENLGTYTPTYVASPASLTLTLAQSRVYFFGKKLWTMEDNVGTAAAGGTFFPWGEQRTGSSSEQYGFATYWQDGESGLDYAVNRYYSSALGRFLSPDPYMANNGGPGDPKDPQSWNRYLYVQNDPVNSLDSEGLQLQHENDCAFFVTACAGVGDNASGGGAASCIVDGSEMPCAMAQALAEMGATFPAPPSIQVPNNYTSAQVFALQQGFNEAWSVLNSNPQCAGDLAPPFEDVGIAYYPGWEADCDHGVLSDTTYRLIPIDPGAGGATLSSQTVVINPNGAFFATPNAYGYVSFTLPDLNGNNVTETLPVADFQAFIMLHELGHQTGVFGPDTGNNVAEGEHSWTVLEDCFGLQP